MIFAAPPLTALFSTLALVAGLRIVALHLHLTDAPGGRKHHTGNIPLVGGIAMFIGILFGLAAVTGKVGSNGYPILAGALLVVVGTLDDRQSLHWRVRLSAEASAALIMIIGGQLIVTDIGDPFGTGIVHLGPLAVVASVLFTVTVINAFNMIDGIDGLAGSLALVAVSAGVLASGGAAPSTAIAYVVIAAIIGFLVFNFPLERNRHLRTFMGDAGSTLLGLVVVWLTITICQGETRYISPVVGLWFVLVPLADLFSCFVQRASKGKSPFSAGREHMHHTLQSAGLNSQQTLGIVIGMAVFYAGIGLLGAGMGVPDFAMFFLWLTLGTSQYWIVKGMAAWAKNRQQLISPAPIVLVDQRKRPRGPKTISAGTPLRININVKQACDTLRTSPRPPPSKTKPKFVSDQAFRKDSSTLVP